MASYAIAAGLRPIAAESCHRSETFSIGLLRLNGVVTCARAPATLVLVASRDGWTSTLLERHMVTSDDTALFAYLS